jgi:hypothetical protein
LVSSLQRRERGVLHYASADESELLRGMVCTLGEASDATLFISAARRDATLTEDGTSVRSIYTGGLHRTATERAKADRLEERLVGARLRRELGRGVAIGATGYRAAYDPELDPPLEDGTYYSLRGGSNEVIGTDLLFTRNDFEVFGEHAWCLGAGRAWLAGASYAMDKTETVAIARSYDWDFYNRHGFALSDLSGEVRNERGALFGIGHRTGGTRLWVHYDVFEHPWRRYREETPTRGREIWLEVSQRLGSELTLTFRRRSKARETRQELSSQLATESADLLADRETSRLELAWGRRTSFRSRVRAEWLQTEVEELNKSEDGRIIFFASVYRPFDTLRLETRWISYATGSYDSRVYEFENDLPGVMRNIALWGRGRRWYLLIGQRFGDRVHFSMKYARTVRENDLARGSGVDERRGRAEHECSMAVDLRW